MERRDDSPLAIDPLAGDEQADCIAERLVADIGTERLAEVGFTGEGEDLGSAFNKWLLLVHGVRP